MKKILIALLTISLATSCVVKPFQPPTAQQLDLEQEYRYLTDTTANIAQTPWREVFTTPTLVALIDTVLASNFDYRTSILRVEQSYAMLRSSRAQIAPSFGVGTQYSANKNLSIPGSNNGSTPLTQNANLGLGLSWEIDLWGKLYAGKESAKADFWQREEAATATRQALVSAVATAYYQLVAIDAKVAVINEAIINRSQYLETTQALKESAKVNEVAVQQAEAQLSDAKAALPNAQMAIAIAENAIALLAGRTHIEVKRTTDIRNLKKGLVLQTGTPAQLLAFRPDVRKAEMNYRAKHYLHMAARAALYPSLTLSAEAGVAGIISAHNIVLNGLAGLTAPIFQGRKLRAQKESAQVEAKIAEIDFRRAIFTAVIEVNDALISIESYDKMLSHQTVQLESLRKAYEFSGDLFMSGYANYIDLLIAQTSVFSIELNIIDSYLSTAIARIELFRALGGGSEGAIILPASIIKNDPVIKNSKNKKQAKRK